MTGESDARRKPGGVRGHADICLHGEAEAPHLRSDGEKKNQNRFRLVDWLIGRLADWCVGCWLSYFQPAGCSDTTWATCINISPVTVRESHSNLLQWMDADREGGTHFSSKY